MASAPLKDPQTHVSYGEPSGPYRASDVRSGQPYEVSNGYKIRCMSQSGRSSQYEAGGAAALVTDPANRGTGVDTGYTTGERRLRAPDLAVGDIPDQPGWVKGVPMLAVEYADTGQNEDQLQRKIVEFLEGGTRFIWVVRLVGPRRVEVYEPGQKIRLFAEGEDLLAPGVLQNPVPVRALFDKEAALEVTLRNLLNRKGYHDLDAVRAEGHKEGHTSGKAEAVLQIFAARGLLPTDAERAQILGCRDSAALDRLIQRALQAKTVAEALG